jgi:hypothetical protein
MNLRKVVKSAKNNQHLIVDQHEEGREIFPSITSVECTKEEITAFLEDGRKVSIPTA